MKFYITVAETRSTIVEVEAENSEEAIQKAEEAYDDDEICLNDMSYIDDGTCFYDETDAVKEYVEQGFLKGINLQCVKR